MASRFEFAQERSALLGSGCGIGALAFAVFYHGPQVPLLAAAQFLLVFWLAASLAAGYAGGIRLPLTPLSVSLSLFWLWLGASVLWSRVPTTSITNFWWVGSIVLAFWCYTLAPQRHRVWFYLSRYVLALALALCAYALMQLFFWGEPPRSTFVNIHSFAALMMLMALPLGARFLAALARPIAGLPVYGLGACLFVVVFTIAITEGRGTTLSMLLGLLVLVALAWRTVGVRAVFILFALYVAAYVSAYLALHDSISGARLVTLTDPMVAGSPRFLIWQGSWEMLKANPWWGIGLGTYYLAWPPYRNPMDTSLGFFVHNDYLQIWIETGLPGLSLLLASLAAVLLLFMRFLRHRPEAGSRLEMLGLFSGLLAVAAHSFLDFNLYILPISILAGLMLGRFHEHYETATCVRQCVLRPATGLQERAYVFVVALLALFPLSYFVALGLSDHLYNRGIQLAAEAKLEEADDAFSWARRLVPGDDKVLLIHADLYRHVLKQLPKSAQSQRRPLYDAAIAALSEAETANPYRALVHTIRAGLLLDNSDYAGDDWRTEVEKSYRRALALDPRFVSARVAYAEFLRDAKREAEAYDLLEQGITYWYHPGPGALRYYGMTADLAKRQGKTERVVVLERKLSDTREAFARMAPARPIVPDLRPTTDSSL